MTILVASTDNSLGGLLLEAEALSTARRAMLRVKGPAISKMLHVVIQRATNFSEEVALASTQRANALCFARERSESFNMRRSSPVENQTRPYFVGMGLL